MRQRIIIVSQLTYLFITIRVFTVHFLSTQIFLALEALMLIAQYFKQGFTPMVLLLLPLLTLQIFGELNLVIQLQYAASILAGIISFIPPKMYWLPEHLKIVGFREDSLSQGGLHYYEFYPLDESQSIKPKSIKWHMGKEVEKMLEHIGLTNRIMNRFGRLLFSYTDLHYLKIGEGTQHSTNSSIAFCHGRGATPFTYTNYLIHFAGLRFKIGAIQHHEVRVTGFKEIEEIKQFREKQVQVRAAELYQTILKVNNSRIVLMGHSYGCPTIIQAYHSLQKQIKDKVSHIVLLDPSFFALSKATFKQEIACPVLILSNENFVRNEDVFKRNNQFLKIHKVQYINWRDADHLHQTDMGFINGNLLGVIKNSHLSKVMFDLNTTAIQKFLKGEKVQGIFGEKDLGRNWVPQKFIPLKAFTF